MKSIYKILKDIEPTINNIKPEKVGNSNEFNIPNWNNVLNALEQIKHLEIFKNAAQELFNISPIFGEKNQKIRINSSLYNKFIIWLSNIKDRTRTIIELCESIGYGEGESSFEVKLPETNDLDEFVYNINHLNNVIRLCPFIKTEDSEIKLIKTDIGSTWLEFLIEGTQMIAALTALGYFTQSALKIKSMYLTCELQKEAVRGAQIKNDLAENITKIHKDIIKAAAANEVKLLEEKLEKPLKPEERNSAEKSLDMLGNLMSKGLEIYATLDSPPEAKDIFPSSAEQKSLPISPQMLTDKIDDD